MATDKVQVGKRYFCATCGTELICVKPGMGPLLCDGAEMQLRGAKPLPSTD